MVQPWGAGHGDVYRPLRTSDRGVMRTLGVRAELSRGCPGGWGRRSWDLGGVPMGKISHLLAHTGSFCHVAVAKMPQPDNLAGIKNCHALINV